MNFIKKRLKPLTSGLSSGFTTSNTNARNKSERNQEDLESDLYDDYVVEAPPHPSELLALGVDPTDIDVNDPDKLRELYKKAKQEGKDKKTNSILLAKQRQKEEIEEKKKTREEWKFFDSLNARVEEAVKNSQKTLSQLKESSAIDKLNEPDYELRLTADQVFKSANSVKQERSVNNWINFSEEADPFGGDKGNIIQIEEEDPFGLGGSSKNKNDKRVEKRGSFGQDNNQQLIVEELFEDLGIDLRPVDQRRESPSPSPSNSASKATASKQSGLTARPRPKAGGCREEEDTRDSAEASRLLADDPFDTSFIETAIEKPELIGGILTHNKGVHLEQGKICLGTEEEAKPAISPEDPFDTSYVNL